MERSGAAEAELVDEVISRVAEREGGEGSASPFLPPSNALMSLTMVDLQGSGSSFHTAREGSDAEESTIEEGKGKDLEEDKGSVKATLEVKGLEEGKVSVKIKVLEEDKGPAQDKGSTAAAAAGVAAARADTAAAVALGDAAAAAGAAWGGLKAPAGALGGAAVGVAGWIAAGAAAGGEALWTVFLALLQARASKVLGASLKALQDKEWSKVAGIKDQIVKPEKAASASAKTKEESSKAVEAIKAQAQAAGTAQCDPKGVPKPAAAPLGGAAPATTPKVSFANRGGGKS